MSVYAGENVRAMAASKTLELNPRHPIVIELNNLISTSPDEQSTKDLAFLLYDTALLASGFQQDDLESYAERMVRTMAKTLNLDSLDLADELKVSEDEEEEDGSSDKANADPLQDLHDEF